MTNTNRSGDKNWTGIVDSVTERAEGLSRTDTNRSGEKNWTDIADSVTDRAEGLSRSRLDEGQGVLLIPGRLC